MSEIHEFLAVDQGNTTVTKVEQEIGGAFKSPAVIHVKPGIGQGGFSGAPVNHEGQPDVAHKGDTAVVDPRAVNDHPVNRALGAQLSVGVGLVGVRDDRQNQIVVCGGIGFTGTRDKVREDRIDDFMLGRHRNDMADGHGATGRQRFGAHVRPVVVVPRGFRHPQTGRLVDLGKAVQGAADRGLRQAKIGRELFEVHRVVVQSAFNLRCTLGTINLPRQPCEPKAGMDPPMRRVFWPVLGKVFDRIANLANGPVSKAL